MGEFSSLIGSVTNKRFRILIVVLFLLYFAINLFHLLQLPVFADEAIYIRWAQLIMDDSKRYLFYPMNDGKTPLLMWLMVPFQYLFFNQLWAGRFVSVLAGAIALGGILAISWQLTQKRQLLILTGVITLFIPFLFFHNRLAITDALLFANLTWSYYFALQISMSKKARYILPFSLFFFLAIFSKTPALLFIPSFYLSLLLPAEKIFNKKWQLTTLVTTFFTPTLYLSLGTLLAGLLFYAFRVVPLFSQLFGVGSSFLYPLSTVFSTEIFAIIRHNMSTFALQFWYYLGPAILFFSLPLLKKSRFKQSIFWLSIASFLLPLIVLGKVVYPRYLLPTTLFFILNLSLFFQQLRLSKTWQIGLLILMVLPGLNFLYHAYFDINHLPLSENDRTQYLEEWSAGQGIVETVELIENMAKTGRVVVATEGYFGTLPDGILLYLHGHNVQNISVEGIGQPIVSLPTTFTSKLDSAQYGLLVVNSHRLKMETQSWQLLKEYCRPNNAPCLQVWSLKSP